MGILYNRFNPQENIFLLPYSNKSKVITYLTPDNFKGNSSTSWGDEYTYPMTASSDTWDLALDGKSVRLHHPSSSSLYATINTGETRNFTVYIVARYAGNNPESSFGFKARASGAGDATIFHDNSSSSRKRLGSTLATWNGGNYMYFSGTSAYDAFQAYSISVGYNSKPIHVLNGSNAATFSYNNTASPRLFLFDENFAYNSEVYIKLLAIVSEAESSTVLQNNINFIREKLNLT